MANAPIASASNIQMDYMKLLVTQLQNQNPLEPMDNNEMSSQLTQFSQLGQLESMNTSFAKVLATTEQNHATSLIGKSVTFAGVTAAGTTDIITGKVDRILTDEKGNPVLGVGNYALSLSDIISVQQ